MESSSNVDSAFYSNPDFDSSSGCHISLELSPVRHEGSRGNSGAGRTDSNFLAPPGNFSPPYKRVRALRLFDNPLTPKTILKQSSLDCCPTPSPARNNRTRLFSPASELPKGVPSAYEEERPVVNVNPFTPNGMLLNKKRTRSKCSIMGSPIQINLNDSNDSEVEAEQQPSKRLALGENNISRYRQEFLEVSLIGKGEFGSVYKCLHRLDGCTYAIKRSTKPVANSWLEKHALNEVYAHAVLGNHQHVVRYFSAWAEDNHMIIQNEYCNGGSLQDRIAGETMSIAELRRLIQHAAEGLRYIHSKGLVHMDIKPGNIFISQGGGAVPYLNYDSADDGFEDLDESSVVEEKLPMYKIGDLGHVTSTVNPEVEEGDCRYLPREILNEDYGHLPKADIFALGLTVLEASGSGPLPKNGDSWHLLRDGQVPPLTQPLTKDLLNLVTSMIHSDPASRPAALAVLQHNAVCPTGKMSRVQLFKELNALKIKNEILSKQLIESAKYIRQLTPDTRQLRSVTRLSSRIIGKKLNRSSSTTTF